MGICIRYIERCDSLEYTISSSQILFVKAVPREEEVEKKMLSFVTTALNPQVPWDGKTLKKTSKHTKKVHFSCDLGFKVQSSSPFSFPSQTASSTEAIDNNGGNAILIVKAALSRACISQIRDQENLAKALTKSAIDLQLFIKSLANQVPKLISFAATLNFCGRSQRLSNRPFQTSKTSKGY